MALQPPSIDKVRRRHGDTIPAPERAADLAREAPRDLRARLDNLSAGHPSAADYRRSPSPDDSWRQTVAGYAEAWQRHQERWPHRDQKAESEKSQTAGERDLALGCDMIKVVEQEITDRLRAVEAQQPGRTLTGLEFCLKGRERVIDKAAQYMREMPGFTPAQALAMVPDPVRYTFTYEPEAYADGVESDIDQLKTAGFEMIKLKNFWHDQEYRGINSQWRDSWTGQRFEVQFHTLISFEAKQITHSAYERLRNPAEIADRRELPELHKLQRDVTTKIPQPPGASQIRDYA